MLAIRPRRASSRASACARRPISSRTSGSKVPGATSSTSRSSRASGARDMQRTAPDDRCIESRSVGRYPTCKEGMVRVTMPGMRPPWPSLPYEEWRATCDTLHAHTQFLGKLAVTLAPPEPQLQHAALRLTARGWETPPLPAPDGSGALVAVLDLHAHAAVIEHSDGRVHRVPLAPQRAVGEGTRELLDGIASLVGPVHLNLTPQEVPWTA